MYWVHSDQFGDYRVVAILRADALSTAARHAFHHIFNTKVIDCDTLIREGTACTLRAKSEENRQLLRELVDSIIQSSDYNYPLRNTYPFQLREIHVMTNEDIAELRGCVVVDEGPETISSQFTDSSLPPPPL
jgi:hypothetical protein